MPFDALTMAAVADELRQTVVGGRIQGVFLPAPLAVGLEIHAYGKTRYLFASAHAQHARLHLSDGKLTRGTDDVSPLLLLLRKYVRDGRLVAVEQPPGERMLSLIIAKAQGFDKASPPPTSVTLVVEVMGRYSNIILVDGAGVVLEAVKHVSSTINRYRVTLPRHPYAPPPPQKKEDPRGVSSAALADVLAAAPDQPAWQVLVSAYRGVSPLAAREAVFRAAASCETTASQVAPHALAAALGALVCLPSTHAWLPSVARQGWAILDFAPYELTQFGDKAERVSSISAAIQAYYAQETVASDYTGLKQDVQKALDAQRARVERRKQSLQAQQEDGRRAESLRVQGEMLLAYATQIAPGQSEAVLEINPGEPPLRISLDPRRSVVENAQDYFARYARARDAARAIPPLLEQAQLDLDYLAQLQLDLDLAATPDEAREAQRALAAASAPPPQEAQPHGSAKPGRKQGGPAQAGKRLPPLMYTAADGAAILVGRNARQNEEVTFEMATASDLWLHARGTAGSHVVVRSGGRPVSPATLAQAAALAAAHSAARQESSVAVDYTQRRNVRRARGGGPGMVTYSGEKTIHVRPRDGR